MVKNYYCTVYDNLKYGKLRRRTNNRMIRRSKWFKEPPPGKGRNALLYSDSFFWCTMLKVIGLDPYRFISSDKGDVEQERREFFGTEISTYWNKAVKPLHTVSEIQKSKSAFVSLNSYVFTGLCLFHSL